MRVGTDCFQKRRCSLTVLLKREPAVFLHFPSSKVLFHKFGAYLCACISPSIVESHQIRSSVISQKQASNRACQQQGKAEGFSPAQPYALFCDALVFLDLDRDVRK